MCRLVLREGFVHVQHSKGLTIFSANDLTLRVPPPRPSLLPQKVLHHVGETWICFIRIMVRDPFDDQLDIRVIHDREEVSLAVTCISFNVANLEVESAEGGFSSAAATIRQCRFPRRQCTLYFVVRCCHCVAPADP